MTRVTWTTAAASWLGWVLFAGCIPISQDLASREFRCTEASHCATGQRCDVDLGRCVDRNAPPTVVTPPPTDAGEPDAAAPDSGRDAGPPNAARPDAAPLDASRPDAARPDAGRPDASRPDGGINNAPPTIPPVEDLTMDEDGAPPGAQLLFVRDADQDPVTTTVFSSDERVTATLSDHPSGALALRLSAAPDFFGQAEITVLAQDPFSESRMRFRLTVRPVNDPPAFAGPLTEVHITEDTGAVVLPFVLRGITPGAGEKDSQRVSFLAEVKGGVQAFSVAPTFDADGTLRLTTAQDFFGLAPLRITITDDGTPPQSATLDLDLVVDPVNDWPTVTLLTAAPPSAPNSARSAFSSRALLQVADPDDGEGGTLLTVEAGAVDPTEGECRASPPTFPDAPQVVNVEFVPAPGRVGTFRCNVLARDRTIQDVSEVPASARLTVAFQVLAPQRSCLAIRNDPTLQPLLVGTENGFYLVDVDGDGPRAAEEVHCRMNAQDPAGAGWTLAMRLQNSATATEFDDVFWTDPTRLYSASPSTALGATEKYLSFSTLPFTEVLVDSTQGPPVVMAASGTSLRDAFASLAPQLAPRAQRDAAPWVNTFALPAGASLPGGVCTHVGLNVGTGVGGRIRLGVVAGTVGAGGACSAQAFVGVGADQELCGGRTLGSALCSGPQVDSVGAGALVYVRESGLVTQTVRASCMAHRRAGETANGPYPIAPRPPGALPGAPLPPGLVAQCDMTQLGGGWTLLFNRTDENALTGAAITLATPRGGAMLTDDHASRAAQLLGLHDLLFTGAGGVSALYEGVGQGLSFEQLVSPFTEPVCDHTEPMAFAFSGGTLPDARLCTRTLYISPRARDALPLACVSGGQDAEGPAFSLAGAQGCPMSAPAAGALGVQAAGVSAAPVVPLPAQLWGRDTDFTDLPPEPTCQAHFDLGRRNSGTYRLLSRLAYCRMDATEAWMRVVKLDRGHMEGCLGDWVDVSGPRACGRAASGSGRIRSALLGVGVPYTRVSGHVRALQQGTPDAFNRVVPGAPTGIDDAYVDGVSITVGPTTARKHVFTYAVANADYATSPGACPCAMGAAAPPAFVGTDLMCDSGQTATQDTVTSALYAGNPLFDGIRGVTCSPTQDPAVFVRTLQAPTTEPLEVRLMADQDSADEDVLLTALELYVR